MSIDENLTTITAHAVWVRSRAWSRQWYDEFFVPLCAEGLFLPPLFAYELRSALERGERRPGALASRRQEAEAWASFLERINDITLSAMPIAAASRPSARALVGLRLARLYALHFMARNWSNEWSALRVHSALSPERILELEAERLSGRTDNADLVTECWQFLNEAVARGSIMELVPLAEMLSLSGDLGDTVDPFLTRLIASSEGSDAMEEPQVRGTNPRADNPRKIVWPTGEFAKRDLGPLPSELGRLSPTELLLFKKGHEEGSNSVVSPSPPDQQCQLNLFAAKRERKSRDSENLRRGFRSLFVLRVAQGQLLQRFSHSKRTAVMEPIGRLQVEIYDDPEYHQLTHAPGPPLVSWYRAVAIQVIHQFAMLTGPFRWSVDYVFAYSFGEEFTAVIMDASRTQDLAISSQSAMETLAQACPAAFCAGWKPFDSAAPSAGKYPPEMDVWIKIVLGRPQPNDAKPHPGLLARATAQRALRVESEANGVWGMAIGDECIGAGGLSIAQFNRVENPAQAAQTILRTALWPDVDPEVAA